MIFHHCPSFIIIDPLGCPNHLMHGLIWCRFYFKSGSLFVNICIRYLSVTSFWRASPNIGSLRWFGQCQTVQVLLGECVRVCEACVVGSREPSSGQITCQELTSPTPKPTIHRGQQGPALRLLWFVSSTSLSLFLSPCQNTTSLSLSLFHLLSLPFFFLFLSVVNASLWCWLWLQLVDV